MRAKTLSKEELKERAKSIKKMGKRELFHYAEQIERENICEESKEYIRHKIALKKEVMAYEKTKNN